MPDNSNNDQQVDHYALDSLLLDGHHRYLQDYVSVVSGSQANMIILTALFESTPFESWRPVLVDLLQELHCRRPEAGVYLIVNHMFSSADWQSVRPLVQDIYFVDFFLLRTWLFWYKLGVVSMNDTWDSRAEHFLFLSGSPSRINRIRLLYKLAQAGLLERCDWNLMLDHAFVSHARGYLADISDEDFDRFVTKYQRTPEDFYLLPKRNFSPKDLANTPIYLQNLVADGSIPLNSQSFFMSNDTGRYKQKSFAIISETTFSSNGTAVMITEKTWNHIAQRLPFVMAAEPGVLTTLSDMGFHTFREHLAIPNYDDPFQPDYLKPRDREAELLHLSWQPLFREFFNAVRDPSWCELDLMIKHTDLYQLQVQECLENYHEPELTDQEARLNAIVTNALGWCDTIKYHGDVIQQQLDHNHRLLDRLGQEEFVSIKSWASDLRISDSHLLDALFNLDCQNPCDRSFSSWLTARALNLDQS